MRGIINRRQQKESSIEIAMRQLPERGLSLFYPMTKESEDNKMRKVKVAATQMSCSWDRKENLAKADRLVREAAAQGANIIL